MSLLQEISRNIDCHPVGNAGEAPDVSDVAPYIASHAAPPATMFDASGNYGNKRIEPSDMSLLGQNGLLRMRAFCDWAFQRKESAIIAAGHSIYFREFFKTFLPRTSTHVGKENKVKNCGVVAFDLEQIKTPTGIIEYRVSESSISPLLFGFEEGKKKK